jgi:hypothetical protein
MANQSWRWVDGSVDTTQEYIELVYGDVNTNSEGWISLALLAPPVGNTFSVQRLIEENDETRAMLTEARRQLDFYLVTKGESRPWEYAKYHCSTAANVYSQVHWIHHPARQPS